MARKATRAEKEAMRNKASLVGYEMRYNKRKNEPISKVYDSTMNRHFDGRRKGILDKAGASDSGYITGGLKRGTYARDDADYKLTGRDSMSNRQFLGTQRRGSARVDQAHAYEQARNKGMTPTQAKRASAGIEQSRLQAKKKKKATQGQAKLDGNTPGKVARGKIVGAVYGGTRRTQATRGINESLGRPKGTPLKKKKKKTSK